MKQNKMTAEMKQRRRQAIKDRKIKWTALGADKATADAIVEQGEREREFIRSITPKMPWRVRLRRRLAFYARTMWELMTGKREIV